MKSLLASAAALLFIGMNAVAEGPSKITDINAALTKAKTENKLLFLEFGREDCENCQALRAMLAKKQVQLPASQFIYADVNCDDPSTMKVFRQKFKVVGSTLPFVILASPEGKQLVAKTGPGTAADFSALIDKARQKAGVTTPKS
ncbi:MAG: Thioredoxin-related protein [Verrucomicrobiaceae bacterium]|nr:Thioredoxin-related protein [Verrucomicrobiaceae bacterium]